MSSPEGNYQDPTRPNQDGSVNYTVKELLARVDLKIDGLYAHLDSKVDTAEFIVVKTDVEDLKAFKFRTYGALVVLAAVTSTGVIHAFI